MAETDIFNPANWQAQGFAFNPNPSYGFERKMGANRQIQRPRMGRFPSRDVMNGGHVFSLGWINTDQTTAQRVLEFYHSFKNGYFTLIDQDWFGRHYVGRFMNEPNLGHPANAKYTFQGVIFEEMPQARMLQYPSLATFGYQQNVVSDDLYPTVALMQGTWVMQVSPLFPNGSATAPATLEACDPVAAVNDWAQTAYTGWGFQMVFRLSPTLGTIDLLLDNNIVVTGLDLSTGAYASKATTTPGASTTLVVAPAAGGLPSTVTVSCPCVSLDIHRVKVLATGPSTGSTAAGLSSWGIVFPQLTFAY